MIGVCPVLLSVQVITAAVGVVVVVLLQPLKDSAAGVITVKFTLVCAAEPVFGVAVSVPEYVPAPVPLVTVTVPQVALPPHAPVGPLTVEPVIGE